jgi:hypothetical protein
MTDNKENIQQILITASHCFSEGDIITFSQALVDHRNWWERNAPHWLGGLPPPPASLVVSKIISGDQT